MGRTLDTGNPEGTQSERPGILGGVAQRLQDGVRAIIEALGQSPAQRLAAVVESSDDAILSVDLDGIIATRNNGVTVRSKAAGRGADAHGTLVDPTARIGERVTIEPGAVVGREATIGPGTTIAAGAVVGFRVVKRPPERDAQ